VLFVCSGQQPSNDQQQGGLQPKQAAAGGGTAGEGQQPQQGEQGQDAAAGTVMSEEAAAADADGECLGAEADLAEDSSRTTVAAEVPQVAGMLLDGHYLLCWCAHASVRHSFAGPGNL
jgi:hypothetical protein